MIDKVMLDWMKLYWSSPELLNGDWREHFSFFLKTYGERYAIEEIEELRKSRVHDGQEIIDNYLLQRKRKALLKLWSE